MTPTHPRRAARGSQPTDAGTANLMLGLDPIGFLDTDADQHTDVGVPWLGGPEVLADLLRADRVDRVMIAFSRAGHEELLQCIRLCRDAGVAIDVVPRLFEFLDGARTMDEVGGMPLLSIAACGTRY